MKIVSKTLTIIMSMVLVVAMLGTGFVFADTEESEPEQPINIDEFQIHPYTSVSTVLVMQPNDNTCGPASAYIALYGCGVAGSISGANVQAKINTLATAMQTNSNGTIVNKIANVMNNYLTNKLYTCTLCTGTAIFSDYVYSSLSNGRIPILHAKTTSLPYYNGNTIYHYIAVQAYDGPNLTLTLYDCNNNSTYYGIHSVPFLAAYNSVAGRYLINYH